MTSIRLNHIILCLMVLFSISCTSQKKSSNGFKSVGHELEFTSTFIEANQQNTIGNLEASANLYRKCLKIEKKSAAANFALAKVLLNQNKKEEAYEHAEKAFEYEPSNIWYGILKVELCRQLGKGQEYIQTLEKLIKENPDRNELKMDLATAYSFLGKTDQSFKLYESIEKQIGITKSVSMEKYKLYMDMGKSKEAEKALLELIKSQPKSIDNLRILASFYYNDGREIESVEIYEKILAINPNDAETHFELYDYYQIRQNEEKAYHHLKIAFASPQVVIDKKVKLLFGFYGSSENDPKLKSMVFEMLDILVEVHPENAKAYSVYGDFHFRDKKYKEAQEMFEKAVAIEPNKYLIWRQIIVIDSELSDYAKMLDHSQQALDFFPTQPELYWFKGIAAIQTKEFDTAVKALKGGLSYVVDNNDMKSQFYSTLGDAYNGAKDYKNSDESYEKSLQYNANNSYVLNNYSYYLSLRKDKLEKAKKMSAQSLLQEPNNVNYLDTYAWILFQLKDFDGAITNLKKALQNGGKKNATVLEHTGDTYAKLGDLDLAIKFWHKAIDQGGNKTQILRKITEKQYIDFSEEVEQ